MTGYFENKRLSNFEADPNYRIHNDPAYESLLVNDATLHSIRSEWQNKLFGTQRINRIHTRRSYGGNNSSQ